MLANPSGMVNDDNEVQAANIYCAVCAPGAKLSGKDTLVNASHPRHILLTLDRFAPQPSLIVNSVRLLQFAARYSAVVCSDMSTDGIWIYVTV